MTDQQLPVPVPVINPETEPFWEATSAHKLMLPQCTLCRTVIWYPRAMCPDCGSTTVEWFEASGLGRIYTYTIIGRGEGPYRSIGAYVLAYVELEEGPRILTNIIGCPHESVMVGQSVAVAFQDSGEGTALPRFRPTGG